MDSLKGWLPIRIWEQGGEWRVDWCWFGTQRLGQPFFRDSVDDALRLPFNQAFRRETLLQVLCDWDVPAVPVRAFIYHASRCGSTLVAQMLARLAEHIVVSEPPPLDSLLRGALEPGVRRAALRGLMAAYGQRRRGDEQALVVKLDAWNIGELPLMRECFPEVPWVFVQRDPVEIAVSHMRRAGMHMVPGMIGASALDGVGVVENREDYIAQRVCRTLALGRAHCRQWGGVLVDYAQLPGAMGGWLGEFFGLDVGQREVALAAAGRHAKQPVEVFVADGEGKRREASGHLVARVAAYSS